jgi:imidazolonepropionase
LTPRRQAGLRRRQADLIVRGIGELVTCDPARSEPPGVVRDAAIAAREGLILFAGPERDLDVEITRDARILSARGAAVLPGFVDSHTHVVWRGDRAAEFALRAEGKSYEEIAAAGGGIMATVRETAAASVSQLVEASRPRLRRMVAHGTTTVEIKSGYGLEDSAEVNMLLAARALAKEPNSPDVLTTYLPLHAPAPAAREAFIDDVCNRGLELALPHADFADAFCEVGAYTVEECRRFLTAAKREGLRLKLHADQRTRGGGALLAAELGAVSADHLEHADDDDLRALAAAGIVGVILPGASLVLGGPPPPGRRLLEAGARIAIATDCNPGTSYAESMPLMVSLAVATAGLTPAQAVIAATSGGAAALGLEDRGVLRPGMRCDLVMLQSAQWIDIAYHLDGDDVGTVVSGGRVINR